MTDKLAEIKAKSEAAKQNLEEIKMCLDEIDFQSLDRDASKEAVKACLAVSDGE